MTSTPEAPVPDEPLDTPGSRVDAAMQSPERDVAPPVRTHSPAYPLLPWGVALLLAGQLFAGFGVLRTVVELSSYYPDSQVGWFVVSGLCTIIGAILVLIGVGRIASHIDDLHLTLLRPDPSGRR